MNCPAFRRLALGYTSLGLMLFAVESLAQQRDAPPPQQDQPVRLSEFLVTTERQSGYVGSNAMGATRTGTPLFDTPQTINVITKDLYQDLQAYETQDAIRYITNIQPRVNTASAWRIRGFFIAQNFKNGFAAGASLRGDSANIEQIEVIKGPSAVVLGQVDPGGSVNRITKKPLFDTTIRNATFTVGDYDYYRGALDLGGPIGKAGNFGYRLNLAYVDDGHFQEHPGPGGQDLQFRKRLIAPSFGWKISDTTRVYIDVEIAKEKNYNPIFTVGVPRGTGPYPDIDFLISPRLNANHNWSYRNGEFWDVQATGIHQFSENWIYRQTAGMTRTQRNDMDVVNIGRRLNVRDNDDDFDLEYQGDLLGRFSTGAINHRFLVGFTYGDREEFSRLRRRNIPGIDPYNPNYNTTAPNPATVPLQNSIKTERSRWSVLGQDQVSLWEDRVKVLLGFRYEHLDASSKNFGLPQEESDDGVVAPRLGLLYQPNRKLSFFGVYSGSERPQRAARPDGSLITDPIEGNMVEFGVKASLLNGRLSMQTSYFDIRRENLANGFTLPDGTETIEPSGLETAKGFEVEVAGYLSDQWQVLFSGGTIDTADQSSFLNYPGSKMGGTMDYTLRLWTNYKFPRGPLNGFEVGGGWIHNDGMYGEDASYVTDPADLFEVRLAYAWSRVKAAVNIENVFDEEWWADAPAQNLTLPGTPRRARLTISYSW